MPCSDVKVNVLTAPDAHGSLKLSPVTVIHGRLLSTLDELKACQTLDHESCCFSILNALAVYQQRVDVADQTLQGLAAGHHARGANNATKVAIEQSKMQQVEDAWQRQVAPLQQLHTQKMEREAEKRRLLTELQSCKADIAKRTEAFLAQEQDAETREKLRIQKATAALGSIIVTGVAGM